MKEQFSPRRTSIDHPPLHAAGEMSVLELIATLGLEKRLLIGLTVSGVVLAIATALLLPRKFVADTLVLPPQQQNAGVGALAQLGALAGVVGATASLKSPDEMYVELLKTRKVQDALTDRFKLLEHYGVDSRDSVREKIDDAVAISLDKKTGLIKLAVKDADGTFAANLANAHVDELRKLLTEIAINESQQRRAFFEQQVEGASKRLSEAEDLFRQEQARSGMVVSDALAESKIRAGLELRSQIAAREVQLQAQKRFTTANHPETRRLASELGALRHQLDTVERGADSTARSGMGGLDAVKAYRNLKTQEAALEALIRQHEIAKLDESRDGPLLQQVDQAIVPEHPSIPNRFAIVIGGALASFFVAVFICIVKISLFATSGKVPDSQEIKNNRLD